MSETDSPRHYTGGEVEVIDIIRAALGDAGFRAFCQGNVIKYALRAGKKGVGTFDQDMKKASNYALWAAGIDWRKK